MKLLRDLAVLATALPVALGLDAAAASRFPRDLTADQEHLEQLTEHIRQEVLRALDDREARLRKAGQVATCTSRNIVFRREYGSLSEAERLDYINAVKCLQSLPPRTPASVAAGAKSRKTLNIHWTGVFQPWHRWFVFLYETALKEECGYQGSQPYWDWAKYADAPEKSPIFDGSPYSLGGNGEFIPHNTTVRFRLPGSKELLYLELPSGVGGGFVTEGPFADMSVNLGPVLGLKEHVPGPDGGLGYNPRRLKRDVGPALNMRYANYSTVLELLLKPTIDEFRLLSEGSGDLEIGPHGGIHYTISGDPGGDFFGSPGDPVFYLHHGMMDRTWAFWQALKPAERQFKLSEVYGNWTEGDGVPTRMLRLDDTMDMGALGAPVTVADAMDTTSGPLCYSYL